MSEPELLDPERDHRALRGWLQLQATLGLSPQLAARLLRETGAPEAALRASGRPARLSERALDASLEALGRAGASALTLLSAGYPAGLAALSDPPPLLWVVGAVSALSQPTVAIVGARAATRYGLDVARDFASELARRGVVILSGLARGIDGAAHRGALEAGGRSIAVLANGPDRVYPPEHARLAQQLRESGALLSELPVGTPPRAAFFPLRNRMISALARVVIVVEARPRSGSLITARHGLDQGTDVMAVPGPIGSPTSEGPNRLIRDGAPPALGVEDVLDRLRWEHCALAPGPPDRSPPEPRSEAARRVVSSLRRAPATRDELGRRLGRSPEQLALDLVELELDGQVATDRDGRLRARGGATRRGGGSADAATS